MGFLDGLFGNKKGGSVIGVDVGSSSLKVVQLRREGGTAVLETYGEIALGPYGNQPIGKAVVQLKLPKTALIVLIHRNDKYLTADGDTIFQARDHLLIMADSQETVQKVHECFELTKS